MMGIFTVISDEFCKLYKDAGVLLILLFAPIFYSLFYPFPYAHEIVEKVPVAVVDDDKSDLSRKIIRMLDSTEEIGVSTEYPSIEAAKIGFYKNHINGVIHIPRGFYKDVLFGKQPIVTLFSDGSYMLFYSETFSSAMTVVLTAAAGVKIQRMTMSGVPTSAAMDLQSSASVISNPLFNIKSGYGIFVAPPVFALILQQLILVAMFLVRGRDYESNTPFPKGVNEVQVFIGRSIVYLICFGLIGYYFFHVGLRLFDIPFFGDLTDTLLFMIPYGLSVVFMGLALSYFIREREGGVLVLIMTSIPLLFLSGFSWPIWAMPEWVQYFRMIFPSNPGAYGFVVVHQMGGNLESVMPSYINLWALTFIYMILGIISVKAQMKSQITYNTP